MQVHHDYIHQKDLPGSMPALLQVATVSVVKCSLDLASPMTDVRMCMAASGVTCFCIFCKKTRMCRAHTESLARAYVCKRLVTLAFTVRPMLGTGMCQVAGVGVDQDATGGTLHRVLQ